MLIKVIDTSVVIIQNLSCPVNMKSSEKCIDIGSTPNYCFFSTGKARELHLVSHNLSELPPLIGKLNFLVKMDLKLNHLTDLPEEFSKLGLLEQLNISKNKFSEIPYVR